MTRVESLSALFKFILFFVLFQLMYGTCVAQIWMPGYNYRKKITINKVKVQGAVNMIDFPVLISFTSTDLIFVPGLCIGNKVSSTQGADIAFASALSPSVPINFQLDSYDSKTGKLICWVKISRLTASGNAAATSEVYLYYGSNIIHKPYSQTGMQTWASNYKNVWHMNPDDLDQRLTPSADLSKNSYVPGKIGTGVPLNGTTSSLGAKKDSSISITISVWIKLNQLGKEQVIVANDSTARGGYCLKVNALGNVVLDFYNFSHPDTRMASTRLVVNQWYYVTVVFKNPDIAFYINDKVAGTYVNNRVEIGRGGSVVIGKSRQNDRFYNGIIDELSIDSLARNVQWITTAYANQMDPASFFSVSSEAMNPLQQLTGAVFQGAKDNLWSEGANWNLGVQPENDMNVIIKAGKKVRTPDGLAVSVTNLVLESNTSLSFKNDFTVSCKTNIGIGATVKLESNARFKISDELINDGLIHSEDQSGSLVFSGNNQYGFEGTGNTDVANVEVDMLESSSLVTLASPIQVINYITLKRGILHSNGKLTLRSTSVTASASVLAVADLSATSITGIVNVEKYIDGTLPAPSTGRGWRLLSSPVYHDQSTRKYHILPLKNNVFITGAGGVANGFDSSPNNGGTVYTHDQSLKGTLTQKYVAFKNINTNLSIGTGIFLFSRGNRNINNAYEAQITSFPFTNPAPYAITYQGTLFFGELTVPLVNSNHGEDGDGFNLVGNPYAAAISWGKLIKQNISPYVWLYDPLNNDYLVTDDANTLISSGSGFFVRVNQEDNHGSISFNEQSKAAPAIMNAKMSSAARLSSLKTTGRNTGKLTVRLSRDVFFQDYTIQFLEEGNAEVDDNDALRVGNGFVSIAAIADQKTRLAIEQRPSLIKKSEVQLTVDGWAVGAYNLNISGFNSFQKGTSIKLTDKYLQIDRKIEGSDFNYPFNIDLNVKESFGKDRFVLLFDFEKELVVVKEMDTTSESPSIYPNPFYDLIHLKTNSFKAVIGQAIIRDFSGKVVWKTQIENVKRGSTIDLFISSIKSGLYLLELRDERNKRQFKSIKIIKQ
jgi:hypothetical protein